jgi:hypothetical protein
MPPSDADPRAADRNSGEVDVESNVVGFLSGDAGVSEVAKSNRLHLDGSGAESERGRIRLWSVGLGSHMEGSLFAEQPVQFSLQTFPEPTPPTCVVDFKRVQEASSAVLT